MSWKMLCEWVAWVACTCRGTVSVWKPVPAFAQLCWKHASEVGAPAWQVVSESSFTYQLPLLTRGKAGRSAWQLFFAWVYGTISSRLSGREGGALPTCSCAEALGLETALLRGPGLWSHRGWAAVTPGTPRHSVDHCLELEYRWGLDVAAIIVFPWRCSFSEFSLTGACLPHAVCLSLGGRVSTWSVCGLKTSRDDYKA